MKGPYGTFTTQTLASINYHGPATTVKDLILFLILKFLLSMSFDFFSYSWSFMWMLQNIKAIYLGLSDIS